MSDGSRFTHGILAVSFFVLSYLWYTIINHPYNESYVWLAVGIGELSLALVFDTDSFREVDEDIRKKMLLTDVAIIFLGGLLGLYTLDLLGLSYGMSTGIILSVAVDIIWFAFFAKPESA